jgi:hypothetical protein
VLVASLLFLGAFLVYGERETGSSVVPLFLWSKNAYFIGRAIDGHQTVPDVVQVADVRSLFTRLISHSNPNSKLASYVDTSHGAPEVILAFIYPQLSSTHASHLTSAYASNSNPSFLQTSVSSSTSSVAVPYVLSSASLSDTLVSLVSTASSKAQVVASQLESKQNSGMTGCNALLNHLQEDPAIFSNGLTDLILLSYDDTQDHENCMSRVVSHVDSHTNGAFVAVLTGEPSHVPIKMVFADGTEPTSFWNGPLVMTEFSLDSNKPQNPKILSVYNNAYWTTYPGVTRVTPNTLGALFFAFFMDFVIYTGVTCVMSIETPVRFGTAPLQLAKEY